MKKFDEIEIEREYGINVFSGTGGQENPFPRNFATPMEALDALVEYWADPERPPAPDEEAVLIVWEFAGAMTVLDEELEWLSPTKNPEMADKIAKKRAEIEREKIAENTEPSSEKRKGVKSGL